MVYGFVRNEGTPRNSLVNHHYAYYCKLEFSGITNVQTNSYKPIIIHNLNNIYIYNIIYIHIVIYIYIILHNYTLILIINSNTHIIFRYLDHTSTWSPALPGRHRPVALHLWRRRWEQPGAAEREPTEGRGKAATARTGLGGVKLWEILPPRCQFLLVKKEVGTCLVIWGGSEAMWFFHGLGEMNVRLRAILRRQGKRVLTCFDPWS